MTALRSSVLLLLGAIAGTTADSDVDELLQKARAKVIESTGRSPRYTCVETISRAQFQPAPNNAACSRRADVRGNLLMRDKLRLDVAIVDGREMFSWAGAGNFETHDVDKLVGGASSSGDFGGYLKSIFSMAPGMFRFQGLSDDFAVFGYEVPLADSAYAYHADLNSPLRRTGFHGTFAVDPADGDLHRLTIETDELQTTTGACLIDHQMDYQRVDIGSGDFLLPEVSTMKAHYRNGAEVVNETHYSDCREYVGESTISFDDVDATAALAAASGKSAQPLARGTRIQIALEGTLDTEAAAAGDEVAGIGTFAREKDRVHGRILRLAQLVVPTPHWVVVIRFDTIERSGVKQPLSLKQIDGKAVSPFSDLPADAGVFTFPAAGSVVLDQKFHSAWETR